MKKSIELKDLGIALMILRDQRDLLMDDLSKIINISYTEDTSGYNVRMGRSSISTGKDSIN